MADSDSIWFRLGYALEQARHAPPSGAAARGHLRGMAERARSGVAANLGRQGGGRPVRGRAPDAPGAVAERPREAGAGGKDDETVARARDALDALMAAGAGSAVARVLGVWKPRRRPGITGLLRGGLAGAVAAYARELVAPIVRGRTVIRVWDDEMPRDLMAGAARGLLYAGVVDGRLPGHPLVRGVAYGIVEHLLSPVGGLGGLLGERAPHRRIPLISGLFEDFEAGEDTLADHLAFAVVLAVLYGGGEEGSGGADADHEEAPHGEAGGSEAHRGNGSGP